MAAAFLSVSAAAICAPLNPSYTYAEFEFYLSDLKARSVIVAAGTDSPVRAVAKARGIQIIQILPRIDAAAGLFSIDGDSYATNGQPGVGLMRGASADTSDTALVLHTSGTTSRPKIIPLSHANLCSSAHNIRLTLRLHQSDRCLNVMPLFHIHGLVGALLSSLTAGASVVCTPGFSSLDFFDWMCEFRPTWYTAVPAMHQEVLAKAALHRETIARCRLRFIRSSSAFLSPKVMKDLENTFSTPVVEAYGMTEAAHQIASNPLPPAERKAGSVGLAAGPNVVILDESSRPMLQGDTGEIAIRGANVSSFAMIGSGQEKPRNQGWFRTGDLGYFDPDNYLFISGRLKEMINRGGEKISPHEVEEVILEHPAIAQAVACSIPDQRLGEDIIAVLVRREGASVSERELREFASTRLASFKIPRRMIFVDQIPKGPTGKIQRVGLAGRLGIESIAFTQSVEPANIVGPRTKIESILIEIWMKVLELDRVGIHDNFFDLGGDSVLSASVVTLVKRRVGVEINARQLVLGTLEQLAAECEQQIRCGGSRRLGWMEKILLRLHGLQ
jgi:acyl-CoA synthetase (AMP-forming)/AMP-acid ligase II